MRTLRRFLVLAALAFWLGGFTFYAAVVVPIGTDVLRSALDQGMITRRVVFWLNVSGACAQVVLLADVLVCSWRCRAGLGGWLFLARLGLWLFLAAAQAALFLLHRHLDAMIDPVAVTISDETAFHLAHRVYLWLQTVQWLAGLLFIALMLRAWQHEDEGRATRMSGAALGEDRMREKVFRR